MRLQDVLLGLVGVYNTTKTENVKATTASTLSRLLRSSPELLPVLLERCGPQILFKGMPGCSSCAADSVYSLCARADGARLGVYQTVLIGALGSAQLEAVEALTFSSNALQLLTVVLPYPWRPVLAPHVPCRSE
jgi:ABC-type arginine transport system permease subunit